MQAPAVGGARCRGLGSQPGLLHCPRQQAVRSVPQTELCASVLSCPVLSAVSRPRPPVARALCSVCGVPRMPAAPAPRAGPAAVHSFAVYVALTSLPSLLVFPPLDHQVVWRSRRCGAQQPVSAGGRSAQENASRNPLGALFGCQQYGCSPGPCGPFLLPAAVWFAPCRPEGCCRVAPGLLCSRWARMLGVRG